MPNPFSDLGKRPVEETYDEWGGQFSCSTKGCYGYAKIAKYFPKEKVLAWQCQDGHISKMYEVEDR